MTVYLVISLPKIPYIDRIYIVLANPSHTVIGDVQFGKVRVIFITAYFTNTPYDVRPIPD